jgi:hypothetical protein
MSRNRSSGRHSSNSRPTGDPPPLTAAQEVEALRAKVEKLELDADGEEGLRKRLGETQQALARSAAECEAHKARARALEDQVKAHENSGVVQELQDARTALTAAKAQADVLRARCAALESANGRLRVVTGAATPLSPDEVAKMIKANGQQRFVVVEKYTVPGSVTWAAGRKVAAHHYPQILALVMSGLKVVPGDE